MIIIKFWLSKPTQNVLLSRWMSIHYASIVFLLVSFTCLGLHAIELNEVLTNTHTDCPAGLPRTLLLQSTGEGLFQNSLVHSESNESFEMIILDYEHWGPK